MRVSARREGAELVLSVTDDGPGPLPDAPPSGGIGLANIRDRLATLHGAAASLDLTRTPEGGARATVRLPYRTLA